MSGVVLIFLGGGLGCDPALGQSDFRPPDRYCHSSNHFENVSGSLAMGILAGYFAFKADAPQC
jgi:hypothetical protein